MIDLFLLKNALRDLMRPRKLLAAVFLILAPGLIILLLKSLNGHKTLDKLANYGTMTEYVVFGFVMVILTVVFCTSVVAEEVENKTIVYMLTRPIPRFRILTVKFLPAIAVTLVTVWLALLVTGVAAYGPGGIRGTALARDLAIAPIGVLAYGSSFLLLSTLLDRPLIYGLLYTFGWETWVPNLPGNFQKLSLMAYLRVLAPHDNIDGRRGGCNADTFQCIAKLRLNPYGVGRSYLGYHHCLRSLAAYLFNSRVRSA